MITNLGDVTTFDEVWVNELKPVVYCVTTKPIFGVRLLVTLLVTCNLKPVVLITDLVLSNDDLLLIFLSRIVIM